MAATPEAFLEEVGVADQLVFGQAEQRHEDRQVRWQQGSHPAQTREEGVWLSHSSVSACKLFIQCLPVLLSAGPCSELGHKEEWSSVCPQAGGLG